MFEKEGISEPGQLALVGSDSEVENCLLESMESGVTDYAASVFATSAEEHMQTRELLRRVAGRM